MDDVQVRITIQEGLDPGWSDWLDGLQIQPLEGGRSLLCGTLPDQAALYGLIARLGGLGLRLVACQVGEVEG